jgi:hypothetical protein
MGEGGFTRSRWSPENNMPGMRGELFQLRPDAHLAVKLIEAFGPQLSGQRAVIICIILVKGIELHEGVVSMLFRGVKKKNLLRAGPFLDFIKPFR